MLIYVSSVDADGHENFHFHAKSHESSEEWRKRCMENDRTKIVMR